MELWYIFLCFIAIIFLMYVLMKIRYNVHHNRVLENNILPENIALKNKLIPRKIFQLVADKNNISDLFKKNIKYIKDLHPGWTYTLYDDKDMIEYMKKHYHPKILHTYNMINQKYGAARADFFRYLLMYREGGVYLDIKSGMLVSLDAIIKPDDEFILCHWVLEENRDILRNGLGEFQQWHIICKTKHPYLEAVIRKVIKNISEYDVVLNGVGKPGVLRVTGPIAYTEAIMPIISIHKHRLLETNEDIGLVYINTRRSHISLFKNKHYSKVREAIVLNNYVDKR